MNLKMDETSGNTIADYSGYENHGTAIKGGSQNVSKFGRGRKLDNHAHIQVNHAH